VRAGARIEASVLRRPSREVVLVGAESRDGCCWPLLAHSGRSHDLPVFEDEVGVLLGATVMRGSAQSPPSSVPLVAAAGVSASGSASLQAKPWGTALTLQLDGLPQGDGFTAWVTALDGTRSVAATWAATPNGHASLTGAASIPEAQLASLQVMQGQTALLTLARPR